MLIGGGCWYRRPGEGRSSPCNSSRWCRVGHGTSWPEPVEGSHAAAHELPRGDAYPPVSGHRMEAMRYRIVRPVVLPWVERHLGQRRRMTPYRLKRSASWRRATTTDGRPGKHAKVRFSATRGTARASTADGRVSQFSSNRRAAARNRQSVWLRVHATTALGARDARRRPASASLRTSPRAWKRRGQRRGPSAGVAVSGTQGNAACDAYRRSFSGRRRRSWS